MITTQSDGMVFPIAGPRRHGVVEFGIELVAAMPSTPAAPVRGVHLQFTDRLFGPTPDAAAEGVRAIVSEWAARGVRVTATLHDVPQPSDGDHFARRVRAYATVCDLVYGVVVNSCHERLLLAEIGITPGYLATIHLPIRAGTSAARPTTAMPSVGIFGFLYPGKGHHEVMSALREMPPNVGLVAIGEPSAGHEHLVRDLRDRGREQGRTVEVTGHVPADLLMAALREVTVPVAHHRHVSASGSLNTWVAAGRRALVSSNRYTKEISARNPEAFLLYEDDETALRQAICRALADPGMTWLPAGTVVTPTPADAAGEYRRLLRRWHP